MAAARSRIEDLVKTQCRIFNHTYNPLCIRTGAKILRQRLKGPTLASYYPNRPVTIRTLRRYFPHMETYEDQEAERLDKLAIVKARGKGPPKKKRSAEESKRFAKRKGGGGVAKPPV